MGGCRNTYAPGACIIDGVLLLRLQIRHVAMAWHTWHSGAHAKQGIEDHGGVPCTLGGSACSSHHSDQGCEGVCC